MKVEDLVYAATSTCPCGSGLAYAPGEKHWDCSAILLGHAFPTGHPFATTHTARLPFAFYEVKPEGQPSAQGATTRPQSHPPKKGWYCSMPDPYHPGPCPLWPTKVTRVRLALQAMYDRPQR